MVLKLDNLMKKAQIVYIRLLLQIAIVLLRDKASEIVIYRLKWTYRKSNDKKSYMLKLGNLILFNKKNLLLKRVRGILKLYKQNSI